MSTEPDPTRAAVDDVRAWAVVCASGAIHFAAAMTTGEADAERSRELADTRSNYKNAAHCGPHRVVELRDAAAATTAAVERITAFVLQMDRDRDGDGATLALVNEAIRRLHDSPSPDAPPASAGRRE